MLAGGADSVNELAHSRAARPLRCASSGVTARRRMAQRGLDVEAGETWAFNELTPEVLAGVPGARDEVLEFLRGL